MITIKEAKETKVFVINNNEIEETNLYDHIMVSAEETTSPRGVENKLHVREKYEDVFDQNGELECQNQCFEVWTWGFRGQYPKFIERFETPEDAENDIFERTFNYDFENDCNRNTQYFETYDDALETMAEIMGISFETLKSIQHHENCKKQILEKRKERLEIARNENTQRIFNIAKEYSKMIEKNNNESYRETCQRLSNAIGQKIEKPVFHMAVKLIRK